MRVSQRRTFAQAAGVIKNLRRWTRLGSIKWEDAWVERLRFLGPDRVAFITWPDSRALKIEAYCDDATAKRLVKGFGGKATKIARISGPAIPSVRAARSRIRGKLKIFADEASWREWADRNPRGIFIPAAHGLRHRRARHHGAPACACWRDLAAELPTDFSALDLGTGSGILAIGAEALGAGAVEAVDYDPAAVRIAKQMPEPTAANAAPSCKAMSCN